MKTWYATKKIEVQGREIAAGDVIGTGEGKDFSPTKGLEGVVLFGHIKARIPYGTVSDVKPDLPAEEESGDVNFAKMNKTALMDYAAENEIDLGGAKTVEEIRAALEADAEDEDAQDD